MHVLKLFRPLVLTLLLTLGLHDARAAYPPPLPMQGPAPLLFVRFYTPPAKTTFFPGRALSRTYDAPVTVGLRAGYIYRVKITDIPDHPGLELYPTLEVRNTLHLPKVIRAIEHPAPVVFTPHDIDRVVAGALVTKVVYLEHPDHAVATATRPDLPLEINVPPGQDPLIEARENGRPLVIIRLGGRVVPAEELSSQAVFGTVLLPEERFLPPPNAPPPLAWSCVPLHDPILGPSHSKEECLPDGGDVGAPAGLDRNGQVGGLDPSDTVAAYTDYRGKRRLSISNRVCICVPRFVIIRGETVLNGYETRVGLVGARKIIVREQMEGRLPLQEREKYEELVGFKGRLRPSGTINSVAPAQLVRVEILNGVHLPIGVGEVIGTKAMRMLTGEQRTEFVKQMEFALEVQSRTNVRQLEQVVLGPQAVGLVEGVNVVSNFQTTRDFTVCCEGKPQAPDQPLLLYKWADRKSGQLGDVVTFFIKYANHGGQPISDVAVSDSLTGRLEYIPGSARADRDAVFTTQENPAGSVVLHWEISGRLLPGASGVVSFQARIR